MDLNLSLPFNTVSFGHCAYNIALELEKRNIYPNIFPIGNNVDLNAYDKTPPEFVSYLNNCITKASKRYKRTAPHLRLWHIQGSEASVSNDTYLFTFRELDQLSEVETNILNNQKKIFVCCEETKRVFETYGVTAPVVYVPLGFDSLHYRKTDKVHFNDDRICIKVGGKFEVRKSTKRVIQLLNKKYGNDRKYHIILSVTNPFLNQDQMNALYAEAFDNQQPPFNFQVLPFLKTKSELNDFFNLKGICIDASLFETWSLPSFCMVALGNHAVIHNVAGVKGWATPQNSCLFEPSGSEIAHDGIFFHKDKKDYSFGNWYSWEDEAFYAALDEAIKRYETNPVNEEGLKLQQQFTWKNTVDTILKEI